MGYEDNHGIALGLTFAAGGATWIGSSMVYFTSSYNHGILAAALGFSAGVMLFVSFVEIYATKAVNAFIEAGHSRAAAFNYSTLYFISGVTIGMLLDLVVDKYLNHDIKKKEEREGDNEICDASPNLSRSDIVGNSTMEHETITIDKQDVSEIAIDSYRLNSDELKIRDDVKENCEATTSVKFLHTSREGQKIYSTQQHSTTSSNNAGIPHFVSGHNHQLQKSGTFSAIAIAIHNFPEGLATFMAATADPAIGVTFALAIALHNIPEGVCISLPLYYSCGSKWRGFLYSFLSGISEPLGGIFGYILIANNDMNDRVYGILFGLVAGIMVYVSCKEMLPAAHKYDEQDKYVTPSLIVGMAVMAGSISLFAM